MIRIFSNLPIKPKQFYQFLGVHSFLIGLFPVLLPSFLWMKGFSIVQISLFIAMSGFGFSLCLWFWDRLHKYYSFKHIIIISFVMQIVLMSAIFNQNDSLFLPVLAVSYGAYNCFFWVSQRVLFFEMIEISNSGRKFGNFQIIIAIILNISIAIGAFFLEKFDFIAVYIFASIISLVSIVYYSMHQMTPVLPQDLISEKPLSIKQIIGFRDKYGSARVFWIDGFFIYLESYFWIISLFLIAHESFLKLGILIVSLAVLLAIIFYFIKNIIDKVNYQIIYISSVLLYTVSWLLRSVVDKEIPSLYLFLLLISITFSTAFFRLSFNKRFFDIAKKTNKHKYLLIKSYWSQIFIIFIFSVTALAAFKVDNTYVFLEGIYIFSAIASVGYLFYKPVK